MANYVISAVLTLKDQMTAKLKSAEQAAKKLTQGIGDAKNRDLTYRLNVQGLERVQRLRAMLQQAGHKLPPINVRVNDNGATSKVSKIRAELTGLAGRAWNVAVNIKANGQTALNKTKAQISELTTGAALGLGAGMLGTAGIGYGVVNAFQSQMDFEKRTSSVQAILGYEKGQMSNLVAEAERIGYSTKFTAAEAMQAMYYQGMAGWSEAQMLGGTQGIVNLAAAGNEDLARTSDVVTDLMTAFGLVAGQKIDLGGGKLVESSEHFADAMAMLITSANTDINGAYEAMKYSAPGVRAMASDIGTPEAFAQAMRDTFVITGLMANAGIKGSMAGTSQRALYSRLASQNRNAYFGQNALGVDFVDKDTGKVRQLHDIIGDFRKRFNEGMDIEGLLDFAETMEGEKIHADTRRKLSSFIENTLAKNGQISGADKMKITSMLAGQEAMSGWLSVLMASNEEWDALTQKMADCEGRAKAMSEVQLDNLAGDITLLGSAWDAFQRNLVKGDASQGLRDFTQGVTDLLTKANNLFADGIQLSDYFEIFVAGIKKLKDKFLELNGLGSILAGGALYLGLKKILSMALNVKDTLALWAKAKTSSDIGNIIRGNASGAITSTGQVGTMHVNAGVVNVNGRTSAAGGNTSNGQNGRPSNSGIITNNQTNRPPTSGGVTANSQSRLAAASVGVLGATAARNKSYVDDYYNKKAAIVGTNSGINVINESTAGRFSNAGNTLKSNFGGIGGAGILAGIFGAIDIYSSKQNSLETTKEALDTITYHKNVLSELQAQGASQDRILAQAREVQAAQEFLERTKVMNANVERQAALGATGAVTGAMAGAALGSFVPIVGTALGGMLGGILGQFAGVKYAEYLAETQATQKAVGNEPIQNIPAGSLSDFRQMDNDFLQLYNDQDYQAKVAAERAKQQANAVDNALRNNASAMSKRQTDEWAERQKGELDAVTFGMMKRRQSDEAETKNRWRMEREDYETGWRLSYGATLSQRRDAYKKKWHEQHGYNSLAGAPNYVPETEQAREALADYDEVITNKKRQDLLMKDIQAYNHNKKAAEESIAKQKSNLDALTKLNLGWQKQQELTNNAINSQLQGIKKGKSLLENLDDFFFNKAAASSITPDTNLTPSSIEPELPPIDERPFAIDPLSKILNTAFGDIGGESSSLFSDFEEFQLPNFGELFANFELPDLGISEKISEEITAASEVFSGFSESVLSVFSGLDSGISGALSGVGSTITNVFTTAANEVQSIWSSMVGFFGGIFGGLGGVASSAGGAIASGLTGVIGGIIGAWQSAAGTISGIISSISAMASSVSGMLPSIGSNAKGTASWKGGFTEINEHGGEILNLPRGTQIIPHATTVKILRHEIRDKINSGATNYHGLNFSDYIPTTNNILNWGYLNSDMPKAQIDTRLNMKNGVFGNVFGGMFDLGNIFSGTSDKKNVKIGTRWNMKNGIFNDILSGINGTFGGIIGNIGSIFGDNDLDLPSFSMPEIKTPDFSIPTERSGGNSTSTNSTSTNNFNFGGVHINNGADFDEFVFQLQTMLGHSLANSIDI